MFERLFQWTVRHGARLLFALAAILFLLGFVQSFLAAEAFKSSTASSMGGFQLSAFQSAMMAYGSGIFSAFDQAVIPLFAALVVNHLDRRWRDN